ncbi:MAG: hypothetical protein PHI27_07830 [Eubacteriales bacterium]|nr:hypothetical protein [Eubacteriales bacterium]MDD3882146.1 hypothetical protein [Eubacteriales bacterium]MDD4513251.1 hypothetical protein [Eubacteriales bacterium]
MLSLLLDEITAGSDFINEAQKFASENNLYIIIAVAALMLLLILLMLVQAGKTARVRAELMREVESLNSQLSSLAVSQRRLRDDIDALRAPRREAEKPSAPAASPYQEAIRLAQAYMAGESPVGLQELLEDETPKCLVRANGSPVRLGLRDGEANMPEKARKSLAEKDEGQFLLILDPQSPARMLALPVPEEPTSPNADAAFMLALSAAYDIDGVPDKGFLSLQKPALVTRILGEKNQYLVRTRGTLRWR